MFANKAGHELLAVADGLQLRSNLLACHARSDEANLSAALRNMCLAGELTSNDPAQDKMFLRVSRRSHDTPLALYLFAVRPAATLGAFGGTPLAMVLVHDAEREPELDRFVVATSFDFTPAEADVAVALAQGKTPEQIATARSVSVTTIRTQMRSAFAKAGVSRQPELVAKLMAMPLVMIRQDMSATNSALPDAS